MRHGILVKAAVVAACAMLGAVVASGCDQFGLGGGGAGGYGGEACGGAGGDGPGGADPAAGCTPKGQCVDMFTKCQDFGYPCTRQIEKKKTLCAICETDCIDRRPYTYTECYKCGFYDP